MQLTFKAIARSAGYRASYSSAAQKWHWNDESPYGLEASDAMFPTEEAAYRDCCKQCGLVRFYMNGDPI